MKTCRVCQRSYSTHFANCPQDGTPLIQSEEWAEGELVRGKYQIIQKIGQGAMGAVYKALHMHFQELRALKVIAAALASDKKFVKRFEQEAILARKLQHPNAVRVDDIDETEDGQPFIVMEYIEGKNLRDVIAEEGPMTPTRVASIIRQVASALDAAHHLESFTATSSRRTSSQSNRKRKLWPRCWISASPSSRKASAVPPRLP